MEDLAAKFQESLTMYGLSLVAAGAILLIGPAQTSTRPSSRS